ncbi:MAG TPA: alpha/beta fold hydrolase [Opitutaceae bacterium]|nr:alpha/beta fold hydrolase [Opitutaceae bacterium]
MNETVSGAPVAAQFAAFRAAHPIRSIAVAGKSWRYVVGGAGPVIVVLPGGGGDADSMFPVVAALEENFRVVAAGYSESAVTADDLVEGVRAVMNVCGVERACLLGHSLGGMVARAFAEKYPARVASLAIANSAIYTPARVRLLTIALALAACLPRPIVAALIRFEFKRLLQSRADADFWLRYVEQSGMMRPGSRGLRNQARCMLDFMRRGAASTASWRGPTLILESDRETGFTPRERAAMRALYPRATEHLFQNAGHLSFITHTDEFARSVANWLNATP